MCSMRRHFPRSAGLFLARHWRAKTATLNSSTTTHARGRSDLVEVCELVALEETHREISHPVRRFCGKAGALQKSMHERADEAI